jgi:hypothetical protein
MKVLKSIAILAVSSALLFSQASCVVVHTKDNGKHKGWRKNPNNPHHPNSTNPGHAKQKAKGKK